MGTNVIRVILAAFGLALMLGGIALGLIVGGAAVVPAFWMIVSGVVLLIVALIEVMRYRSEAADGIGTDTGPGGGEPGPLEPRFRPTDEIFVDPTTQRRMRVYADGRTGERRYVAEG
jgi:hypothetical protein